MELETVTQRERVDFLVVGNRPVRHLRLRLEILVHGDQHIVDHIGMITRDMRRRDDRIEDAQIGMHDGGQGRFSPCIAWSITGTDGDQRSG